MTATLHICLLGDFRLTHDGEPVTSLSTDRLQSLLAYLVLHRGAPQARRHIAFSFWPDSREKQAYNNLRNLLYRLRQALPEAERFLDADANTLCWRADAPFTLDVADFERRLAQAHDAVQRADPSTAQAALEEALHLYGGDLLTGLYDDWILPERERLRQESTQAFELLIQLLETERDYAGALYHAQRLLQLDPLREPTYRLLMRLHALNQDRASVRRAYEQCVEVLERELDMAPDPATRALYERLSHAQAVPAPSPKGLVNEIPLVGRRAEWKALRAAWREAEGGRAQLVTVTGEAGIGKTRLAEELLAWAGRQGVAVARSRSYAAEGRLAYAPVVEWLRAEVLRPTLSALDAAWLAEVARLLPELYAEHPDLPEPEPLREGWQRQRLFEALARAVLAPGRPLVLLLDDLQWCDQDTLEWLRFLLRFGPEAPLLLLGTIRIEEMEAAHPLQELLLDLGRTGQVTEVTLEPLPADETARLAREVAGRELEEGQADWLYRETEGNPLFVVESVRAGLPEPESETGLDLQGEQPAVARPQALDVPPTVRAVITKRLAQLSSEARSLVALAATIGRAFTFDVLLRASQMRDEQAIGALDELWQRRIVREYGADAYDFSHDKLREAAYAAVTPARKRLLHRRVAEALEGAYAGSLDAVSAQVAAHYDLGGQHEQAVAFYRRAAHAAQQVGSNQETIQLLTRAMDLLDGMPRTRKRDEHELALLMALGIALRVGVGHGAPEVEQVFERARSLSTLLGETTQFFAVQRGRWAFHLIRSEYGAAQALGEELLALADDLDDEGLRLESEVALGLTGLWRGELVQARGFLEQALVRYDPERHHAHALRYGQDPGVAVRSLLAYVRWLLGYPEQAAAHIEDALVLAEERAHPFSLAYALQHAALVHQGCRDAEATHDRAAALVKLSQEHGFAYWLGPGLILQGWALAEQGRLIQGLALLRQGLAQHRATGSRLSSTLWLGLLAEACRHNGQDEEALKYVEQALSLVGETGERVWEAELHRLAGELLLRRGQHEAAAEALEKALRVAREQQARSLELRAAMRLGRLWHRQGRTADAHDPLQAVYAGFNEGFEIPDLQEARRLLAMWA